jgi:hypothetical protein
MPKNATAGALIINRDLSAAATWAFAPSDTTVRLSKIPGPTSTGRLPDEPEDGDTYEVIDADGSCNAQHIVLVLPPVGSAATISGLVGFALIGQFSGARFTFDAGANNWNVSLNANAAFFGGVSAGTGGGPAAPGNFAGGAAVNLCAFGLPIRATGIFRLFFALKFTLSAADTVNVAVETVNNVTAITGGGTIGVVLPSFNYEQGVGPGQPVVVTGDAPVTVETWSNAYGAAGEYTLAFTVDIQAPTPAPATPEVAIVLAISTAAATMTAMSLATTCVETQA